MFASHLMVKKEKKNNTWIVETTFDKRWKFILNQLIRKHFHRHKKIILRYTWKENKFGRK